MTVETVKDGVKLIGERGLADGIKVKAQIIQEKLHLYVSVNHQGADCRGPAKEDSGGVHLTPFFKLKGESKRGNGGGILITAK